ncbi:MAG: TonB-dependent receptor [Bacteroidales bacterium]|nr:TonB-dependent receptor [Bacteroidales bacterium]
MLKQTCKCRLLLLVAAIFAGACFSTGAYAAAASVRAEQASTCTGVVIDETGQPVIGAAVLIKGTLKGTSTDIDGRFTLPEAKSGDVLQISAIGYTTAETVWNGTPLNIVLGDDKLALEESVVVGYGVQKKVNVTGAVSMVGSDVLASRPVQTVSQALQGQIPGLNFSVTTGGGELNQNMSFNVRGAGTVGSGSAARPLVLIDGIEGDMNTVNPGDIESISVLKDAASASIYGARGAFGVILVTTQGGKAGKTHVSYNGSLVFNSALHLPRMMSSDRFVRYWNRARANDGTAAQFSAEVVQRVDDYIAGRITTPTVAEPDGRWGTYGTGNANTDWFSTFYDDNVPSHNHNLSVSGGNDRINYRVSGSFRNTNGLLSFGTDKLNRYNLDAKISAKLSDWARIDYGSKFTREDYTRPTYLTYQGRLFMHNIARRWPNIPVYDPNGHLIGEMETETLRDGGDELTQKNYYTTQLGLVFEPVRGWHINLEGNMRTYTVRDHQVFVPVISYDTDNKPYYDSWDNGVGSIAPGQSRVYEYRYSEDYFTTNIYSDYSFSIGGSHNFHVLGGFNAELTKYDQMNGRGDNMVDLSVPYLDQITANPRVGGGREHTSVAGFFGRVNYNYLDRYLLEVNGRYDGSSRFIGDKRWAFFPSVSAGWNIARESFFSPLADKISTLKLRASWGRLGNTNTVDGSGSQNWYPFYQTMPIGAANGSWLIEGAKPNTAYLPAIVSTILTWETIETWDAGLDVTALGGRLNASFDCFLRKTMDMVGPAPELPAALGASVPKVNNADMKSNGWELELSWRDQVGRDFSYGARLVLSDARQEITRYPNMTNSLSNYYVGRMIGEIWGYEADKLASSQEEMDSWLASNRPSWGSGWGAGDLMYKDLDGDGKVTIGSYTLDDHGDLKIIGNSTPRYNFGLTLDAAWRGFDMRAYLQGVGKRDYWCSGPYMFGTCGGMWQSAAFEEHWDFWRPEGDEYGANLDAYYPKPTFNGNEKNQNVSTRYLQDASYIRLKNLQVGYTLPSRWTSHAGMSSVRVYASGENLFTLTRMTKVFDPETIGGDWGDGKVYPLMKTYSVGVNINF